MPVFTAVLVIILMQAAAASMPANRQRKSASLMVGATVLPYVGKQGKMPESMALYISRVPGERYY